MATNNAVNTLITTTPTANAISQWDSNKNMSTNSIISAMTSTARSFGTTYTLTVASTQMQQFTGIGGADLVAMPVTSTLALGQQYTIINSGSSPLSICTSAGSGNQIVLLPAGATTVLTCILTSGTTAASWYFTPIYVPATSGTCAVTAVSCQTPGNLSIAGLSSTGNYRAFRTGPTGSGGIVCFNMSVSFTPTWTTASGQINFTTNLPFNGTSTSSSISNFISIGALFGPTWSAGQTPTLAINGGVTMFGYLSASGTSPVWAIANFPSGTACSFVLCGSYPSQ